MREKRTVCARIVQFADRKGFQDYGRRRQFLRDIGNELFNFEEKLEADTRENL